MRIRASSTQTPELKCFLCDLPAKNNNPLRLIQSCRLDQRVGGCAYGMRSLYAKLQNG